MAGGICRSPRDGSRDGPRDGTRDGAWVPGADGAALKAPARELASPPGAVRSAKNATSASSRALAPMASISGVRRWRSRLLGSAPSESTRTVASATWDRAGLELRGRGRGRIAMGEGALAAVIRSVNAAKRPLLPHSPLGRDVEQRLALAVGAVDVRSGSHEGLGQVLPVRPEEPHDRDERWLQRRSTIQTLSHSDATLGLTTSTSGEPCAPGSRRR